MNINIPEPLTPEELQISLAHDGGRTVMHGGDPYDDDLEPDFLFVAESNELQLRR